MGLENAIFLLLGGYKQFPEGEMREIVSHIGQTGEIIEYGLNLPNQKTVNACRPRRGGFYIHDSTKGYSHGCIEVEGSFFSTLRATTSRRLTIEVKYIANRPTNGGTGD